MKTTASPSATGGPLPSPETVGPLRGNGSLRRLVQQRHEIDRDALFWQRPRIWLDDGPQGKSIFGLGAGWMLHDNSSNRFDVMRTHAGQMFANSLSLGTGPLAQTDTSDCPAALVAFAFSDGCSNPHGPWREWPAAWLYVPETLVELRQDRKARVAVQSWGDSAPADTTMESAGEALARPQSRESYLQMVRSSVDDIMAGRLDKVVMARRALLEAPQAQRFAPLASARSMRQAHPGSIGYFVDQGQRGTLIGATPETLVRVEKGRLFTAALAGTAPAAAAQHLAKSGKDVREQQLVVDAMVAALKPLCRTLQVAAKPRTRQAGRAVHLETPIEGELHPGVDLLTVARSLHPTPALGGWPREVARQTIANREGMDRGWYGGALGWLAPNGDGMLAVTIRCALLRDGKAHAFAGAGIVAGSEAEREWQETELKLAGVRESLQLVAESAA